jgi:DNA-directed RNA polymerase I subunit RPA49
LQPLLQNTITTSTAGLPTSEEVEKEAESQRPVPQHDPDAQTPEDVYKLNDIVPEAEMDAVPIGPFMTSGERTPMLPYKSSMFINERIKALPPGRLKGKDKRRLRWLVMLAYHMAFRTKKFDVSRPTVSERLGAPDVIVDGLLDRFTELSRDGDK